MLRRHVVIVPRRPARHGHGPGHPVRPHPPPRRAPGRPLRPRHRVSAELEAEWSRLGLTRLPLDVMECPDRRLTRAALELAAETVADGETELTILLPRRGFAAGWHRLLHDRTADRIAAAVGQLAHVNATVVPYQLTGGWLSKRREWRADPTTSDAARRPWPARTAARRARQGRRTGAERERPGPRSTGPPSASGRRDHADRRGRSGATGSGWPAGSSRSGSSPGRAPPTWSACWPTTPAAAAGVPGPAAHPGDPARGPAGGRGHGRGLGPPPGHPQPRLRAHRRPRGRGRADLRPWARGGSDPSGARSRAPPRTFLAPGTLCRYLLPRCRIGAPRGAAPAHGRSAGARRGGRAPVAVRRAAVASAVVTDR